MSTDEYELVRAKHLYKTTVSGIKASILCVRAVPGLRTTVGLNYARDKIDQLADFCEERGFPATSKNVDMFDKSNDLEAVQEMNEALINEFMDHYMNDTKAAKILKYMRESADGILFTMLDLILFEAAALGSLKVLDRGIDMIIADKNRN